MNYEFSFSLEYNRCNTIFGPDDYWMKQYGDDPISIVTQRLTFVLKKASVWNPDTYIQDTGTDFHQSGG